MLEALYGTSEDEESVTAGQQHQWWPGMVSRSLNKIRRVFTQVDSSHNQMRIVRGQHLERERQGVSKEY